MSVVNRATFTSPEDLVNFHVWVSGSSNNNKFFVAAYNVNSPNARGFKQSVPCQVLQNGAEVFNGNLICK